MESFVGYKAAKKNFLHGNNALFCDGKEMMSMLSIKVTKVTPLENLRLLVFFVNEKTEIFERCDLCDFG